MVDNEMIEALRHRASKLPPLPAHLTAWVWEDLSAPADRRWVACLVVPDVIIVGAPSELDVQGKIRWASDFLRDTAGQIDPEAPRALTCVHRQPTREELAAYRSSLG